MATADTPNERGPKSAINRDDLVANKQKQEEEVLKHKRKVGYSFDDKKMNAQTPRKDMYEAVLKDLFHSPLEAVEKKWEDKRNELIARKEAGEEITIETLQKETGTFSEEMADLVKTLEAYFFEETQTSQNKKFTPDVLVKMLDSKSKNIVDILLLDPAKYGDLIDALKWSLGRTKNVSGTEAQYDEKEIFATLEKYLEDPGVTNFIWTIIAFIDPAANKIKFLANYTKELDPANAMKVLEQGNLFGAISTDEMEAILNKSKKIAKVKDEFEKNKDKYTERWTKQNIVIERAKELMGKSYRSVAGEMLTLGNTALFLVKSFLALTITANTGIALFYKANFKSPAGAIKSVVTNPYNQGSAAILGLMNFLNTEEKKDDYTVNKKASSKEYAKANMRETISSKPEIREFFDHDNFQGINSIYQFGQWVKALVKDESEPLPERFLTRSQFESWLELRAEKEPQKYSSLQGKLPVMDNDRFAEIVRSVYVLGIGETSAKDYREKIKESPQIKQEKPADGK